MLDQPSPRSGRASTTVLALAGAAVLLIVGLWLALRGDAANSSSDAARALGAATPESRAEPSTPTAGDAAEARADSSAPAVVADGFSVQPGVRLSGPGRLTGRVLERASGAAVAGAQVELLPLPPVGQEFFGRMLRLAKTGDAFASRVESIAIAASGADGSFMFEGVRTGTYYVQARAARHVPDSVARVVVAASGEGGPLDVFTRVGGRVIGTVLLPNGKPAGGAKLALTLGPSLFLEGLRKGDGCYLEARSDDAGQFVLCGIPPADGYDVTATGAGFALSHALDVNVKAGEDTLVVVKTRWGGGIEGRVVTRELDDKGKPGAQKALGGAHVAVVPRGLRDLQFAEEILHQSHTVAGPDGRYRIDNIPPGEFDLVGVADGHLPSKGPRALIADSGLAVADDFELPRGALVSGRVVDRAGQPVEGVTVRWNSVDFRNFQFDFSFAPLLAAAIEGFEYPKTDGEGRFTAGAFAGEPPHRIDFFKSGYENANHRWDPSQEKESFEVVLDKGGALEGIVMDAVKHVPVTSFTIETNDRVETQADAPGNMNPFSGGILIENEQGRFRIDPVKSGEKLRISIRARGYLEKQLDDLEVGEGETLRGVIVELAPGGTVKGSVTDKEGRPIGGAQVFALPSERAASFERRSGGRRGGNGGGPFGGGPPELEQMPPGLRDFAAQMGLLGDRAVTSKPDGTFELSGLNPGSTTVLASHRDYVIGRSEPVVVVAGAPQEVEIELSQGGGVFGHARDRFARPVAGAIVIAMSPANFGGGESRANGGGLYQSRTDASGAYKIERMVGGGYFVLLTRGDEALNPMSFLGTLNFDMVTVPDDEQVEYDIVDTSSGATHVSGRVLDGGQPVASGSVTAMCFESESMLGVDLKIAQIRAGSYEFAGLAPGEYQFNVDAGRRGGRVRITAEIPDAPEYTLDLEFPEGAIEGRVVDARDGAPVKDAELTLRAEEPFESSGWLGKMIAQDANLERERSGEDGTFRFERLNAGRYRLTARASQDDATAALAPSEPLMVEVHADAATRDVEVRLVAAVELTGRVVDGAGAPVAEVLLLATRGGALGEQTERATSDDDGAFHFAALAAGTYDVSANADGYADALKKNVVVDAAKSEPLEIVLERGIDVSVKIVGATGQPVQGATGRLVRKDGAAEIAANDVGRAFTNLFNGKGVSDAKGILALGTFNAGDYRLEVQRGAERAQDDVTLAGSGEQVLRIRLR